MPLELAGISKVVDGEPWLTGVDLVAEPGLNLLIGPSQAGKTTLMRLAAGLDHPDAGRIIEDGTDVTHRPVRQRDVGFVYQEFVNYPSMTVFDNIAAPLRLKTKLRQEEVAARVHQVADLLGLAPQLDRRPAQLSGGQQQRVAIARALARETRLLVLDEPLANLDYKLREELRDELARIFATRSSVVLYATSDPLEALVLGGRATVLHEGRVLQSDTPERLYHAPAWAQVARTLSDPPVNLVPGQLDRSTLALPGGARCPRPPQLGQVDDGPVTIGVRPHALSPHGPAGAGQPGQRDQLVLRGELLLAELTGSATYLHLRLGDGPALVAELPGIHHHRLGAEIDLHVDPETLLAFDTDSGRALASPEPVSVDG